MYLLLPALLLFSTLIASDDLPFPPRQEVPRDDLEPMEESEECYEEESEDEEIYYDNLEGILLLDSSSKLEARDLIALEGVRFKDVEAPGGNDKLSKRLSSTFINRPLTSATLNQIKREIACYYRQNNYPLVKVIVYSPNKIKAPKEYLDKGILCVVLLEARLGKVAVKCNQYTSSCDITKWIRVQPGSRINELTLMRDINWINTNPFRQVNISYRPGETIGTTDIDLVVSDRKPWRFYIGGDNTGTPHIGKARWFTGLNLSDIFFQDHLFSFQFTTSSNFRKFNSYTFQYAAPLPWRNTLSLFGAYATVYPSDSPLKSQGKTYQGSGRYTIPVWYSRSSWVDQVSYEFGFDFKGTNNNIVFGTDNSIPVFQQQAWIGQFTGSIHANVARNNYSVFAGAEAFWSPGKMLPHQTDADYANLRAGATAKYLYGRFSLIFEQRFPRRGIFYFQGRLQVANANLLASEQFALGGYSTVRGYDERVVNGDNAFCLNFEYRAPAFKLLSSRFCRMKDSLYFLGFVDVGYASDNQKIVGLPRTQTLVGVGPGVRYHIFPYVISRFDLGFPLNPVQGSSKSPHIHFSAILSY